MLGRSARTHLAYAAIALLAGCDGCETCKNQGVTDPVQCAELTNRSPANPTFAVRIWSGEGQFAPRGSQLPQPIVVYVGFGDQPNAGTFATFTVEQGGGRLIGPTTSGASVAVATGTDGTAGVRWEMGSTAVLQQVRVTFGTQPNSLTFNALGYGSTARVEITGGDGQNGDAFAELPTRPAVKVVDQGVVIPGMRVWFIPQDGGTPVDGTVSNTGLSGVATMNAPWRLGGGAGTQRLIARVLDGPTGALNANLGGNPATFTATVAVTGQRVRRNPSTFPEPQNGVTGQAVTVKPSVRVSDANDQSLAGVSVRFAIASGGGNFGSLVILHESITDANGIISVPDWVLGASGTNTVTATVLAQGAPAPNVLGNPITFTAIARDPTSNPTPNLTLAKDPAGDNQSAIVNSTVGTAPRVRVTDSQGRGVSGIAITWAVTQGSGSFLVEQPTTNSDGYAGLTYFGPTVVGQVKLQASATDSRVSPSSVTFTITGTPRP